MNLAGIVLYNPEEKRLLDNIKSIINQVDKLILIDNASDNIQSILNIIKELDLNIDIIQNDENKGIAYALNQILNYAHENKYSWFLTLDQDSMVNNDIIEKYNKYINLEKVAMISCEYEDLNANKKKINFKGKEYIEVENCITSATYCNTNVLKECGGFDNKMFIDCVDFDICETIREKGYKIIKINYKGFKHEVGKSENKKILGIEVILYNHSPFRVYYFVRNSMYFAKKHKMYIKTYFRLIKRIFLILLYQENKKENLKNIIKGIKDYKKM